METPLNIHNVILSHMDREILIKGISEEVTANILKEVCMIKPTRELPEKYLNIQLAADLLDLTVPTMYSKVSRGELPYMKRGKRLYFSREDLLNYIKEGKRKSSAEIEAEVNAYMSNKKSAAL